MQPIVFTDLDGTLLNHHDYDFSPALPALERLKAEGIPVVMVTSKTRPEVLELRERLGIDDPFIVENGAAVLFPEGYRGFDLPEAETGGFRTLLLGRPYEEIRAFFETVKKAYGLEGFGDMETLRVAELTGLSPEKAETARVREFTEPFICADPSVISDLEVEAARAGLKITRGGRFYHLIGQGQDKGRAVRKAVELFRANGWNRPVSIALGDGKNDEPMLETAEFPIQIPTPSGEYVEIAVPLLRKASLPGPAGWNEQVLKVLDELAG